MFHIQLPPQNWHTALLALPRFTPPNRGKALVKAVSNPSILREAKQVWAADGRDPARLVTLYRHFDVQTIQTGDDWPAAVAHWQAMFKRWVDGTYLSSYAAFVDLVSEANEYTANTTWLDPAQKAWALLNVRAASAVWNSTYRGKMGIPDTCRLALLSGPVGNFIPREVLELAIADDQVIDYHAYWNCNQGARVAHDFTYNSGYFDTLEQMHGLSPRWVFGEAGPFSSAEDGWLVCLGGDRQLLASVTRAVVADIETTAACREDRIEGTFAMFTCDSPTGTWRHFVMTTPDLVACAPAFFDWNPGEDRPMTPDERSTLQGIRASLLGAIRDTDALLTPPLYQAVVLTDLALRDAAGNPISDPAIPALPQPGPAGVVKTGTVVNVYREHMPAGTYPNRAVITASGENIWMGADDSHPTLKKA